MDAHTRTALVVALVSLFATRAATASTYRWTPDANGQWTNPANWTLISGATGDGYPNRADDVAEFLNVFTLNRTITVNQSVTLGVLRINENNNIQFSAMGAGRFVFNAAPVSGPALLQTLSTGSHVFALPVTLAATLAVDVGHDTGTVTMTMGIDGTRDLIKRGPGTLHSYAIASNSYTGITSVTRGMLELEHLGGALAINGPLVIGEGAGQSPTAIVKLSADHQIADTSSVRVLRDGLFSLPTADDAIGPLTVTEGFVSVGPAGASILAVSTLSMTGGTVDVGTGSALTLGGHVDATSTATERAFLGGPGTIRLNGATRWFTVTDGPQAFDLDIAASLVEPGSNGVVKDGAGTLRFSGTGVNNYGGATQVRWGRIELARTGAGVSIPAALDVGGAGAHAEVHDLTDNNIHDSAVIKVFPDCVFVVNNVAETVSIVHMEADGSLRASGSLGGRLTVNHLWLTGAAVDIQPSSLLILKGTITATSSATQPATIGGGGLLTLQGTTTHGLRVSNGPQAIDLQISSEISSAADVPVVKNEPGVARLDGPSSFLGTMTVAEGTLLVNTTQPNSSIRLVGGVLGGNGQVGPIAPGTGGGPATVTPGTSPGILTSKSLTASAEITLWLEIFGTTPGSGHDQLNVIGSVDLASAKLIVGTSIGYTPPAFARYTIIDNDGTDPIAGTFAGLPEGADVGVGDGLTMTISYVGGDGNDAVLISQTPPSYFLAEGATGGFFDDDVLIANPNTADASVTLTFLQEGGGTLVEHRTVAAQSRLTVHVDQIAGLENASPSVQVTSDGALPLVVERTMFWDASYYGGHTANAVAKPELTWIFAEGFQGFFDTYILIANANADSTTATITFLRENDTPVVKTVPVAAFSRHTVYAGDYSELVGRAFGIVVAATLPVIAERAMYFGSLPGRLWTGGHANTGIAAASTSWFHAEGATGGFFNTFILLSNPQDTAATVDLRFLLDNGEVIARQKTIGAKQRLTVNPATEGDARLENAAVSTVVLSDVPIVSERSMYWPGDAVPFGEGHNSAGVVSTATRWGLAEGRIGGPYQFATYILLANPQSTTAEVTITYLREGGAAPIAQTYTVPATSRFNVDVGSVVPELRNDAVGETFGARIEVTNGVPIAVERSVYWNANGVFWAGGTNALATPLP